VGTAARALALSEHAPAAWHGVLAHALLAHNGRFAGPAPALEALERAHEATSVNGLREQARLAHAAFQLALRSLASVGATSATRADPLARSVAAAPRRGREILHEGRPVGLVLLDGEHPASELHCGAGTITFDGGRAAGHTVACAHHDAQLSTPPLAVPDGLGAALDLVGTEMTRSPLGAAGVPLAQERLLRPPGLAPTDGPAHGGVARRHQLPVEPDLLPEAPRHPRQQVGERFVSLEL